MKLKQVTVDHNSTTIKITELSEGEGQEYGYRY